MNYCKLRDGIAYCYHGVLPFAKRTTRRGVASNPITKRPRTEFIGRGFLRLVSLLAPGPTGSEDCCRLYALRDGIGFLRESWRTRRLPTKPKKPRLQKPISIRSQTAGSGKATGWMKGTAASCSIASS